MTCETCGATNGWVDGVSLELANESKRTAMSEAKELRDRLTAMTTWLEANQPDVFMRGIWDVMTDA